MSQVQQQPDAVWNGLLAKASEDNAFRQRLLSRPRATIEAELGVTLPSDLEVLAVEETPTRVYLVLPSRTAAGTGGELGDAELGQVAGGFTPIPLPMPAFGFNRLLRAERRDLVSYTPITIP